MSNDQQQTDLRPSSAPMRASAWMSGEASTALLALELLIQQFTGITMRPTPAAAWQRFHAFPADTQSMIVNAWKGQTVFIQGALDEGLSAFDDVNMLRYALSKLNLLSDSSVLADIQPGDVLEISNQDYVQVYRSFSYFSLCNYSLLELSAYPWYELYERSSLVTKQLMEVADKVLSGKATRVSFDHVPEYTLRELMTEDFAVFTMQEKYAVWLVSPLTGENYVLSVKRVKELDAGLPGKSKINFI